MHEDDYLIKMHMYCVSASNVLPMKQILESSLLPSTVGMHMMLLLVTDPNPVVKNEEENEENCFCHKKKKTQVKEN
jgi:hypothetical protein